jgi:uncharacterized damage-inducible protein DinB
LTETRPTPPGNADERTTLKAFLDLYRQTMVMKIEGLDEEQARWTPTEQANSLLNLIVHLIGVERGWFQETIAGREVDRDRDAEFAHLEKMTVARAVGAYRDEWKRSDEVLDRVASLDDPCKGEAGFSVRWVLLHMLEETARHAGHADITRELIDGTVGF